MTDPDDLDDLGAPYSGDGGAAVLTRSHPVPAQWVRPRPATAVHLPAPSPQPPPATGIDYALSQALRLIDGALTEHRDTGPPAPAPPVAELFDGEDSLAAAVRTLIGGARRELVCVSPFDSLDDGALRPVAELMRRPAGPDAARVRALIPSRGLQARRGLRGLLPEPGAHEARVTETPLQEMVLVDRQTALVVSRPAPTAPQGVMVANPVLVSALYGLFVDSWRTAGPLQPLPLLDDPRQHETAVQVLASLRDGRKDDVAARELGLSVRTYRRYVADFMRDIDATSRFQAGVRAAELRLLPTDKRGGTAA